MMTLAATVALLITITTMMSASAFQQSSPRWQWNEMESIVGKDYTASQEVDVYDATHANFRDIAAESCHVLDDLLQAQQGQSIVDFGCGTGTLVLEASKRGLTAHGVDVSTTMLQMAHSKVMQHSKEADVNLDRIHWHHAGFLTHQQVEPVDFVTTTYALHHLPDLWKQEALQRIANMLKSTGKLHLRDVVLSTTDNTCAPTHINRFVQAQAKLGEDNNDDGFLKDDAEGHFREEFSTYDWIMEGMLERAGLTIVKKEVECDGVIATYLCEKKS